MIININSLVRGRLTERGMQVLRLLPQIHLDALLHRYDPHTQILEISLWQFAQVFGPHLYGSAEPVVADCLIELVGVGPAGELPENKPAGIPPSGLHKPQHGGRAP